ncbi:arginine deiminase family protein [Mesorhizobium sp. M0025]
MPRNCNSIHLDTIFTFCDRDLVTIYPPVVELLKTFSLRPNTAEGVLDVTRETRPFLSVVAEALGLRLFVLSRPAATASRPSGSNGLPQIM